MFDCRDMAAVDDEGPSSSNSTPAAKAQPTTSAAGIPPPGFMPMPMMPGIPPLPMSMGPMMPMGELSVLVVSCCNCHTVY